MKFLTPVQYRTANWTIFDDIKFFTEHPELCLEECPDIPAELKEAEE